MLDNHHHGAEHVSVKRFFRPPYVSVRGWVGVALDRKPDWGLVESLVRDAYVHVAPRKLLALL